MNAKKLKNNWLLNFEEKKTDGFEALWICGTIYDGHFCVKINPIRENWINRWNFFFRWEIGNKNHQDLYESTHNVHYS